MITKFLICRCTFFYTNHNILYNNKKYLNLSEAGELLGVSRQMVSKLTTAKDFPCTRLKRRVLINKDKLLNWLEENKYIRY